MTNRNASKLPNLDEVKTQLLELARVGQAFVDGDLCRAMLQPYAETFAGGDDLDLNPAACVPVKKVLTRLERLSRVPCSTAIWRRRPDSPDRVEVLLFGAASLPGVDKPPVRGYQPPPMFPEIKPSFLRGRTTIHLTPVKNALAKRGIGQAVRDVKDDALLRLFAPIRDSMGEIAVVLEIFTAIQKGRAGSRRIA